MASNCLEQTISAIQQMENENCCYRSDLYNSQSRIIELIGINDQMKFVISNKKRWLINCEGSMFVRTLHTVIATQAFIRLQIYFGWHWSNHSPNYYTPTISNYTVLFLCLLFAMEMHAHIMRMGMVSRVKCVKHALCRRQCTFCCCRWRWVSSS